MLPADTSRCCGESGATVCDKRADCERYAEWKRGGTGAVWVAPLVCTTRDHEAWIPRACAGQKTRVSNRPHPLCRNGCRRWQYGTQDGITPYWTDIDGTASCGDRVVHVVKVGDEGAVCAPAQ